MTKKERAEILRNSKVISVRLVAGKKKQTFEIKGVHMAQHPGKVFNVKTTVRVVKLPKPTGKGYVSLGPALNHEPSAWVTGADGRQAKVALKPSRRKTPNLGDQRKALPGKLPVILPQFFKG